MIYKQSKDTHVNRQLQVGMYPQQRLTIELLRSDPQHRRQLRDRVFGVPFQQRFGVHCKLILYRVCTTGATGRHITVSQRSVCKEEEEENEHLVRNRLPHCVKIR